MKYRIVDIHESDAYSRLRGHFVGQIGEFKKENDWREYSSGDFRFSSIETHGYMRVYFASVKLEPVEKFYGKIKSLSPEDGFYRDGYEFEDEIGWFEEINKGKFLFWPDEDFRHKCYILVNPKIEEMKKEKTMKKYIIKNIGLTDDWYHQRDLLIGKTALSNNGGRTLKAPEGETFSYLGGGMMRDTEIYTADFYLEEISDKKPIERSGNTKDVKVTFYI